MSRRRKQIQHRISPDPTYKSVLVNMLVHRIMKDGKKALAYKIVYTAMDALAKYTDEQGLKAFEQAIYNITPVMEVKSRRVGGATYQIPQRVTGRRGVVLAMQWILAATRKRNGQTTSLKLANEFADALNKQGAAMKRRTDMHRMAAANKAFARFGKFQSKKK
jgi:small subunit ribosomal protein S7